MGKCGGVSFSRVGAEGNRGWRGVVAALGVLAIVALAVPKADAFPSCPQVIISCGCVINDSAFHTIGADLNGMQGVTGKGDCIDIAHSGATLDGTGGFSIVGGASGVGIRILAGATHVTVQNISEVTGWNIGIEDDANFANINAFDANENGKANVFVRSASKSVIDDFDADDATGSCVLLQDASRNAFGDFDASGCSVDGLTLIGSRQNSFTDFSADNNTGNGVTLSAKSGKNSLVTRWNADSNGVDGVFISDSSGDKVADGVAFDNVANGIEIKKHATKNSVNFNTATGNGGTDMLDGNPNCDTDVWSNDCFNTSAPSSCIILSSGC
jgi:Right handed beta helix region